MAVAQRPVWVAEDFPELRPGSPWGEFEKAEFCLEGVRQADCFIAIITSRHGSQVHIDGVGPVPTSFFEAELFEAALLGKPSHIFLLEGFEPEGKLASILKLLAPAFPDMILDPLPEHQILRRVDRLVRYYQRPRWLRQWIGPPRLGRMVTTLFSLRHRPYDAKSMPPPLRFLGHATDPFVPRPDAATVNAVLERARQNAPHQVRLTLIYFAVRALMGAPYHDSTSRDLLPLWEQAMSDWVSNGGWYGLHGHFLMSCLSALGTLSDIRANITHKDDPAHGIPHGDLGSAYYSIAKLAGHSQKIFKLALKHVDFGIAANSGTSENCFAVRASIYLQQGHYEAALSDYERVATARQEVSGPSYGEALSEWGYALLISGNRRVGLEKMEKGCELLAKAEPTGFRIRALRKLAVGYVRSGKFLSALGIATEARNMALEIGALDQIRTFEKFAYQIHKLRGTIRI